MGFPETQANKSCCCCYYTFKHIYLGLNRLLKVVIDFIIFIRLKNYKLMTSFIVVCSCFFFNRIIIKNKITPTTLRVECP